MPRTRKATAGPTAAQQSRLSFNNRVTKPGASGKDASAKKVKDAKLPQPAEDIVIKEIIKQQSTPEPEVKPAQNKTARGKAATPKKEAAKLESDSPIRLLPSPSQKRRRAHRTTIDDDEVDLFEKAKVEAQKVSDARIKKYWKMEEDTRLAPRVHQQQMSIQEKMLHHFDLSNEYGPCIGLDRTSRWKRAVNMGLQPPIEILAILLQEEKKGKQGVSRSSIVDDLMAGGRD